LTLVIAGALTVVAAVLFMLPAGPRESIARA
jgi:hypothetical protein